MLRWHFASVDLVCFNRCSCGNRQRTQCHFFHASHDRQSIYMYTANLWVLTFVKTALVQRLGACFIAFSSAGVWRHKDIGPESALSSHSVYLFSTVDVLNHTKLPTIYSMEAENVQIEKCTNIQIHKNTQRHKYTYGSDSAGRGKCLFYVFFFLKSRASVRLPLTF